MTRACVFVTSVHALIAPDFSSARLGGALARSQTRFHQVFLRQVFVMSETAQRGGVSAALVTEDEAGMRLDRWFKRRFPALTLSHLAKICRKGEVRVDGKKVETSTRLEQGQTIRIPPLNLDAQEAPRPARVNPDDARDIAQMTLFEDKDVMVLNKPYGLAVQGGSGTTRHIDGMLASLAEGDRRPVLVHRLDRDTSGVLLVAKNRRAAARKGLASLGRGHCAKVNPGQDAAG
ncbi:MAG: pseudouridine synthase [Methylocystis sp.]